MICFLCSILWMKFYNICRDLHFVVFYILHSVPTILELGLEMSKQNALQWQITFTLLYSSDILSDYDMKLKTFSSWKHNTKNCSSVFGTEMDFWECMLSKCFTVTLFWQQPWEHMNPGLFFLTCTRVSRDVMALSNTCWCERYWQWAPQSQHHLDNVLSNSLWTRAKEQFLVAVGLCCKRINSQLLHWCVSVLRTKSRCSTKVNSSLV